MRKMKAIVWGHPYLEFPEGQDSRKDMERFFEEMVRAGISVYMPFVATNEGRWFRTKEDSAEQKDLLQPVLEVAKEYEVEVHPILLGFLSLCSFPSQKIERMYEFNLEEGERMEDYKWAKATQNYPCPSCEENRRRVLNLYQEIIENYPVDGIHLDAVRYFNTSFLAKHPCQCEACRKSRSQWLGHEILTKEDLQDQGIVYQEVKMRNNIIKGLVKEIRSLVRKHHLKMSMAARADYTGAIVEGQDWVDWCKDELLDFICTMAYAPDFARFEEYLREHQRLLKGITVDLYIGIGVSSSRGNMSAQQMAEQIKLVEERGGKGYTLFYANALKKEYLEKLQELGK